MKDKKNGDFILWNHRFFVNLSLQEQFRTHPVLAVS